MKKIVLDGSCTGVHQIARHSEVEGQKQNPEPHPGKIESVEKKNGQCKHHRFFHFKSGLHFLLFALYGLQLTVGATVNRKL